MLSFFLLFFLAKSFFMFFLKSIYVLFFLYFFPIIFFSFFIPFIIKNIELIFLWFPLRAAMVRAGLGKCAISQELSLLVHNN